MVICIAADCKSERRFYKFPKDENLKKQYLIIIKHRNIQSIQYVRMCHAYCFGKL